MKKLVIASLASALIFLSPNAENASKAYRELEKKAENADIVSMTYALQDYYSCSLEEGISDLAKYNKKCQELEDKIIDRYCRAAKERIAAYMDSSLSPLDFKEDFEYLMERTASYGKMMIDKSSKDIWVLDTEKLKRKIDPIVDKAYKDYMLKRGI